MKNMNVSEAIHLKRAVREFKVEPLADEVVEAILNAGRRAQSSKNSQPWHFIAIRDRERLKALSECGNWAGHLSGAALGVALAQSGPDRQIPDDVRPGTGRRLHAARSLGAGGRLMSGLDLRAGESPRSFWASQRTCTCGSRFRLATRLKTTGSLRRRRKAVENRWRNSSIGKSGDEFQAPDC